MRKDFYWKLAASNIRNNRRTYVPYIITCIATVAMFFIVCSLSLNSGLDQLIGGNSLTAVLGMGTWITGLFAVIFLFYTNSFLMKRRKKELGLYNILGMEKKHIARVICCETLYILLVSLVAGLALGLLLNRLLFLVLLNLLRTDIPLQFEWSEKALATTLILFGVLFFFICLNSLRQIHLAKPIELLKGGQMGEREPKAKWVLAIVGVLLLGSGYAIAVTTTNPLAALSMFFLAVILVILGTYCLFLAGSIALLKLLRKNKRYYYHPRHFTSVSGLIYRMKQNAVGLANICILSTAVLVMISSTLSLYLGMENILSTRYPRDILISYSGWKDETSTRMHAWVDATLSKEDLQAENTLEYTYLSFAALQQKDYFNTDRSAGNSIMSMENVCNLVFLSLEDYNHVTGEQAVLQDNEVLLYANGPAYEYARLRVFDESFSIKQRLNSFSGEGLADFSATASYFVVVPDKEDIERLYQKQAEVYGDMASSIETCFGFDLSADREKVLDVYHSLAQTNDDFYLQCMQDARQNFLGTFGGLFFVGLFLGLLFIMATILIIYYKQVSEGYDDRERFAILQKVGMSRREIRRTIHSQVLVVLFLPLIVAGVHMAFAFPAVTRILRAFSMTSTGLFAACTAGVFLVFTLLYAAVYVRTARSYYKIVSESDPGDAAIG